MNAELLAMLGQIPGSSAPTRRESEPKTLLSFKAGKLLPVLQPNGRYLVTADPRRGTLELNWTANANANGSGSGGRGGGNSNSNGNRNGNAGVLKLEWKDRRTRAVVDTLTIFPEDDCSYTKVDTGRPGDRVYLLQYGNASDRRFFFWMQDGLIQKTKESKTEGEDEDEGEEKEGEKDGEEMDNASVEYEDVDEFNCVKINTFMAEPEIAARVANGGSFEGDEEGEKEDEDGDANMGEEGAGGSKKRSSSAADTSGAGALDSNALQSIMQGLNSSSANAAGSANSSGRQVDALSNILENLGMPQTTTTSGTAESTSSATDADSTIATATASDANTENAVAGEGAGANNGSIGLTLSDLQGAMAGLATTSPTQMNMQMQMQPPGPPLTEVLSPENILESQILTTLDGALKTKLLSLLPEHQRTEAHLLQNLRSPQVQQCLQSLTAALLEDEASVNSIMANLELRPEDGAIAMASGNPIQAFLDCVLKASQRESADADNNNGNGNGNDNENDEDDAEMKE